MSVNKRHSKGKRLALITKSDNESSNSDDGSNSDNLTGSDDEKSDGEVMQLATLMAKSLKKMTYKKFQEG